MPFMGSIPLIVTYFGLTFKYQKRKSSKRTNLAPVVNGKLNTGVWIILLTEWRN